MPNIIKYNTLIINVALFIYSLYIIMLSDIIMTMFNYIINAIISKKKYLSRNLIV